MNYKGTHVCFKIGILALLLSGLASGIVASELAKDPLFRAMSDELTRSVKKLKMEKLERPFYVEYRVQDYEWVSIDAAFGGLVKSDEDRKRFLIVDLRVGDYSFDNTNYVGRMGREIRPQLTSLVTEDNYDALRHQIWLATDKAYKSALETLAKKKACVKMKAVKERPDDFSREKPFTHEEPGAQLEVERWQWEGRLKRLSAIFRKWPAINDSKLEFRVVVRNQHFVNSEGSSHRRADGFYSLEVTASTQAEDGMKLSDFATFYARSLEDFPNDDQIAARIERLARRLTDLAKGELMNSYTGPVVFSGQASAEFFNQLLAKNISNPRTPLLEEERMTMLFEGGGLAGKLTRRVLPKFISVVDDPTLRESEGSPLIGWYAVDDDGVQAQRVSIVKDGKLVGLPMSRVPVKKITESNGHGRGGLDSPVVGNIGNLIIHSEERMSSDELKQELISICKDMELEYGILVRRMSSEGFGEALSSAISFYTMGKEKPQLTRPIQVYKIWVKDGKEELVRGAEFSGITVRALRDIVATLDGSYVHNFVKRDRFGQGGVPCSIVVPSILVEEMELSKISGELPKPPILKHPYFD